MLTLRARPSIPIARRVRLGMRGSAPMSSMTFDRPSYAEVQLQVAAYVHQEVLFDHDSIDLGNVDQGAGAAGKIVVYRGPAATGPSPRRSPAAPISPARLWSGPGRITRCGMKLKCGWRRMPLPVPSRITSS